MTIRKQCKIALCTLNLKTWQRAKISVSFKTIHICVKDHRWCWEACLQLFSPKGGASSQERVQGHANNIWDIHEVVLPSESQCPGISSTVMSWGFWGIAFNVNDQNLSGTLFLFLKFKIKSKCSCFYILEEIKNVTEKNGTSREQSKYSRTSPEMARSAKWATYY